MQLLRLVLVPSALCGFTQQHSSGNNAVLQGASPALTALGLLRVTSLHLWTMLGIWGWMLCNWQFCNM